MRFWIESRYNKKIISDIVMMHGNVITKNSPEFVITYGGDGTILEAEEKFPGIPKIPIRKSMICSACQNFHESDIYKIMEKIMHGKHKVKYYDKVEATFKGKKIYGLNEVQIHNADPRVALRFSVQVGKKKIENAIGDGIIAATVFGSTAYYKSAGYKPFKSGIKIGFNNTTEKYPAITLDSKSANIKILREEGLLLADNSKKFIKLKKGDTVIIKNSPKKAKFVEIQ